MVSVALIVLALVVGIWNGRAAPQRGRSEVAWGMATFFVGLASMYFALFPELLISDEGEIRTGLAFVPAIITLVTLLAMVALLRLLPPAVSRGRRGWRVREMSFTKAQPPEEKLVLLPEGLRLRDRVIPYAEIDELAADGEAIAIKLRDASERLLFIPCGPESREWRTRQSDEIARQASLRRAAR